MEQSCNIRLKRNRILFIVFVFQLLCNIILIGYYLGHEKMNLLPASSGWIKNKYSSCMDGTVTEAGTKRADFQVADIKEWTTNTAQTKMAKRKPAGKDDTIFPQFFLPIELPIPQIVHQILWTDTLNFRNYLSILSVWKILKPYQIILYTRKSFKTKEFDYNDWFDKATSRIASLQVVKLDLFDNMKYSVAEEPVGARSDLLARSVLKETGGVYVNINTIINSNLWLQFNSTFHAGFADDSSIGFLALAQN